MLCALRVRNLLLLDQLELNLEPGFNVMTGETGGGKSVVIGALKLVLGGRALPEQVRPGCEEAEVEALFDLSDSPAARARLLEAGVAHDDELVVRRVLSASSRSRAYLNGRLTAASELTALAPHLADIASQHESVTLTDPSSHLGYLDAFGSLDASRKTLAEQVEALHRVRKELAALEELARDRAERDAFLRFQLAAIDEVAPKPGETDALRLERSRLRSATRLASVASRAAVRLVDTDPSVCDDLRAIVGDLRGAVDLDPLLGEALALVESANNSLLEAGRNLQRYAENVQADPARLDAVEERLFTLEKLLRLHGPTEDDAVAAR
ncbi:MAG: AAA family ATPase, partial [Polyangiaceae bacterium]|nr:AAA family ATPase [Polyangiaceae bacterium]